MEKIAKPKNVRKTIYLKTIVSAKIEDMAKRDGRTFSAWVARLLERAANEKS